MRRGAFVEVDGVYIAFDDVDKANGIGFFQDGPSPRPQERLR